MPNEPIPLGASVPLSIGPGSGKGAAINQPSAGFARIAEAVFKMQHRLQALEEENRRLHEALAGLRRGVGITVVIEEHPIRW